MGKKIEFEQEKCVGCGVGAGRHPWVAVKVEDSGPVSQPVCDPCHRNPEHRTRPIKGHFFPRRQEETALAAAGNSNIGG